MIQLKTGTNLQKYDNILDDNVGENNNTPKHANRPRTMHPANWTYSDPLIEEIQMRIFIYSNNLKMYSLIIIYY